MNGELRICIVGEGAMGQTHAEVLSSFPDVRLTALVAGNRVQGEALARRWNIPTVVGSLGEAMAERQVDAFVIASPSGLHVEHALAAAAARVPTLVEIPAALTVSDTERLLSAQQQSQSVLMVAQSRRFSPAHRHLRQRMRDGSFSLHHLVVETYFFRRTNTNMFGEPRSWTDHLLWHHACHSVDLAAWLLEDEEFDVWGQQGPLHPDLGIAMDMSIGMRGRKTGTLVTMALSFNNQGPFGGFYRYIGEQDTYRAFRDTLTDSAGKAVSLEGSAFELQDRAFVDAARGHGCPESDICSVAQTMRLLGRIEESMQGTGGAASGR